MKYSVFGIMFSSLLLVTSLAQAITVGKFAGGVGIIRILTTDRSGSTDGDAQNIFKAMDLPIQNSMLGPGKVLKSADNKLQFICAERGQGNFECSLFIQRSQHSTVSPNKGVAQYKVQGPEAKVFTDSFFKDSQGEFLLVSVEGNFKVQVRPDYFEVLFSQKEFLDEDLGLENAVPTLIVSDIDDTLKVAHVGNFWDSLNYARDTKTRFLGMSEVLQALVKENPQAAVVYLSRAPRALMAEVHEKFLQGNRFPTGVYMPHQSGKADDHKIRALRGLIAKHKPQKVILIGDNSEQDPQIYNQISEEFKNVEFYQYIHTLYSSSSSQETGATLFPHQIAYVTSVELAVELGQKNFLNSNQVDTIVKSFVPRIVSEPADPKTEEMAFPDFVRCEDFVWKWSGLEGLYTLLEELKKRLDQRCFHYEIEVPTAPYL